MRFIWKSLLCLSSMLMLVSITRCEIYEGAAISDDIKSATFVTKSFDMKGGTVKVDTFWNIDLPKGHIGVKSFDAEIVDEEGNSVPLYEVYVHHWFLIRYHEKLHGNYPVDNSSLPNFMRNDGPCSGYVLPHHWGLGVESRGTPSLLPDPYAVELGSPTFIPPGFEEKWLLNFMVIDTRGTKDAKGCTQCRCNLFNLPKNHLHVTKGIDGKPLGPSYKGGLFCCQDKSQCKLKKGFEAPTRKLSIRYKIRWVEWNQNQIPLRFYILDVKDRIKKNGSEIIHDCQVEYTIPKGNSWDNSPHVQKANIQMKKGGDLIYAMSHMHTGVINATLYGQDGKILCTSVGQYGNGNEAGNEKGYLVGMSVCRPEPGSIQIKDGEILTLEARYKRNYITGAMAHMYIYLADPKP